MIELPQLKSLIYPVRKRQKHPSYGGIYAFYSKEGYLVYIGKTESFKHRFSSYFQNDLRKFISFIEIIKLDDETDREIYETYYINKWMPLFNAYKVYTYKSYTQKFNNLYKYSSITEMIDEIKKHNDGFEIPNNKKIEIQGQKIEFNKGEISQAVKEVMSYHESMLKSEVRRGLVEMGFNVEEMDRQEFEKLMMEFGYGLSKMNVLRKAIC